jgi:nucleoside-diphosphate-sugar epimerase
MSTLPEKGVSPMRVAVFGATGGSGKATVEELLDGGHQVTAFSRHACQLDLRSDRLRRVEGDAMKPGDVDKVVRRQEAVVVTLGVSDNPLKVRLLHRSKTPMDVCSQGTRNIIRSMKRHGVRKLVVESAFGVGDTWQNLPPLLRWAYGALILDQLRDKELQERLVRESGLDWTIVRPVALTDGKGKGAFHAGVGPEVRRSTLPRKDLGRFISEIVPGRRFVHEAVSVSSV